MAGASDNPVLRADQSSTLQDLGGVRRARGDLAGALTLFRDGLAIAQTLADAAPADLAARNRLAIAHRNVGDVLLQQKEIDAAAAEFDAASGAGEKTVTIHLSHFSAAVVFALFCVDRLWYYTAQFDDGDGEVRAVLLCALRRRSLFQPDRSLALTSAIGFS